MGSVKQCCSTGLLVWGALLRGQAHEAASVLQLPIVSIGRAGCLCYAPQIGDPAPSWAVRTTSRRILRLRRQRAADPVFLPSSSPAVYERAWTLFCEPVELSPCPFRSVHAFIIHECMISFSHEVGPFGVGAKLLDKTRQAGPTLPQGEATPADLCFSLQEAIFAMLVSLHATHHAHTFTPSLAAGWKLSCHHIGLVARPLLLPHRAIHHL